MLRSISALMLLIPIACFGDIPESIVGRWQFDSVRTMTEYMDQVFEANPEVATPEQIQEQKTGMAEHSAEADQQLTATITEDTISTTNSNSRETKTMSYKVVGGNTQLVVIDATLPDGNSFHINFRLVESGIAMETLDCHANPDVCKRERTRSRATDSLTVVGSSESEPRRTRPGPTQPQWIYFRPFPSSPDEKD